MSEGKGIMESMNEIIDTLAHIVSEGKENPNLREWIEQEDISLPLAFAVKYGFATLTERGENGLMATYNYAKQIADERGLDSIYDLVDTDTEIPRRLITITIPEAVSE